MKKSILILMSLILLGGCMNTKKERTLEETKQILLNYMSEKYNEEFEITAIGTTALFSKVVEADMVSKTDEQKNTISMSCDFNENTEVCSDNYTDLLYKFQVNDFMDSIVEAKFKDFNYATFSEISRVEMDKYLDTPLTSLMKTTSMIIETNVLLDESAVGQEALIKEKILSVYEEVNKQSSDSMHFIVYVYVCENDNFKENEQLAKQDKELYSISGDDLKYTFNNYDKKILKEYHFTTKRLEDGVEER